jgi:acyl-CoA synthetase (AMP-forming)/AMP-acid ligase II
VVERWQRATGVYLHNTYGLTETAAPSHLVPAGTRAPVDQASGALSVGVPIPDTDSRVVSLDDGRELGAGEVGEIVTRGPGVTPAELITHCRELIAVYKAPRRVVVVDEIPKTLTGKALRRELRERERRGS